MLVQIHSEIILSLVKFYEARNDGRDSFSTSFYPADVGPNNVQNGSFIGFWDVISVGQKVGQPIVFLSGLGKFASGCQQLDGIPGTAKTGPEKAKQQMCIKYFEMFFLQNLQLVKRFPIGRDELKCGGSTGWIVRKMFHHRQGLLGSLIDGWMEDSRQESLDILPINWAGHCRQDLLPLPSPSVADAPLPGEIPFRRASVTDGRAPDNLHLFLHHLCLVISETVHYQGLVESSCLCDAVPFIGVASGSIDVQIPFAVSAQIATRCGFAQLLHITLQKQSRFKYIIKKNKKRGISPGKCLHEKDR